MIIRTEDYCFCHIYPLQRGEGIATMLMNMVHLKELFLCFFQPLHIHPVAQRRRESETDSFLQCTIMIILFIKVIFGLTGPIWDPLVEEPPSLLVKLPLRSS